MRRIIFLINDLSDGMTAYELAMTMIRDQIFIANATYLGSYGNAANTVVFPLTVVALAIAVMIGDGCCAFVSIIVIIL